MKLRVSRSSRRPRSKLLAVDVAKGNRLQNKAPDSLYGGPGMAMGRRVVRRKKHVMSTTTLQETWEVAVGELHSAFSPWAKENTKFPEETEEDEYGMGGLCRG